MTGLTVATTALLVFYGVLGYRRPAFAFITAPFAAIGLGCIAVYSRHDEYILAAPVVFVLAMISVAASSYRFESREWYHRWASILLISLVVVLLLAVFLAAFEELGTGFILPVLFLLGIGAMVMSLLGYAMISRRAAAMNVFSTLGSIMRQNLPLAMALDFAANGSGDATAWALRRIKTWLVKGYSLTEALRRGYPQCPSRALALVATGERINQLPAAIQTINADLKSHAKERTRLQPVHPAYPVIMLVILFLFTLGIMRFIIPQFQAVLSEMTGGPLPRSTVLLIEIMQIFVFRTEGTLLLLLGSVFILVVWLRRIWWRRRPEKPYLLSRIGDSIRWYLPIFHWFEINRAQVQVAEVLRLSLNAGCPVNEAIRSTLGLDVNWWFRMRLACWLQCVERGDNIGKSARKCGLGNALAWAFEGGADTGNTPTVLEMLESHYRSSYSYRVNLTRFILWPLGIILLGATVGFVVYAVFASLVAVISQTSAIIYP